MTRFRAFRNGDPPALADLWNRALPARNVVRPLTAHEFDALIVGKLTFDPAGLIVAERDGRVVGFAHAGFGPVAPLGPSHRLDPALGTVAMLAVEPGLDDPDLERGLIEAAEGFLRSRGASVVYAGGRHPLDPFYWGLYGGTEFAGVLDDHAAFARAAARGGFEPAARATLIEADLSRPEPRDPRAVMLRRLVRTEVVEDALPAGWWEGLAIGSFRPTRFTLVDRSSGSTLARATTWDIASGVGVGDGLARTGMMGLEVDPSHRRRGLGRLLVAELMRHARDEMADRVVAQTDATNAPALGLYASLGFEPVGSATLYRKPGGG